MDSRSKFSTNQRIKQVNEDIFLLAFDLHIELPVQGGNNEPDHFQETIIPIVIELKAED